MCVESRSLNDMRTLEKLQILTRANSLRLLEFVVERKRLYSLYNECRACAQNVDNVPDQYDKPLHLRFEPWTLQIWPVITTGPTAESSMWIALGRSLKRRFDRC